MTNIEARYEELRTAFLDLQDRHQILLKTGVTVEKMEHTRAALVKWACAEASRWLDPRAGNGPTDEMGKKLLAMAFYLAQDASALPVNARAATGDK